MSSWIFDEEERHVPASGKKWRSRAWQSPHAKGKYYWGMFKINFSQVLNNILLLKQNHCIGLVVLELYIVQINLLNNATVLLSFVFDDDWTTGGFV